MTATTRDRRPLWVRVTSRTAGRFGLRFYNMLYGERSLVEPVQHVEPPPDLEIRRATARELELVASKLDPPQAESCRIAAAQQSRCLLAMVGQDLAGYSWLNTDDIYLLQPRGQRQCSFRSRTQTAGRPVSRRTHSQVAGPESSPIVAIPLRRVGQRV